MRRRIAGPLIMTLFALLLLELITFVCVQSASGQQSPPAQSPSQPAAKQEAKPDSKADTKPETKEDPLLEASRKAKAKQSKSSEKKVFTEDDLSRLNSRGVSVVGSEPAADAKNSGEDSAAGSDANSEKKDAAAAGAKNEQYWRGRASKLREQIEAVDREIEKTKDEMKKGGTASFDVSTGMSKDVVYVTDRNARLKQLEKKKEDLEKQFDALRDEGLKAGAEPGWFR
jgi:hypothetical protein